MYIASLEHNLGGSRIEILELQLAHFTAIHGIGPFAAELLDIELMRSQTYFLVGIETDTDFTVFDFRMLFQIGYRRNNLRDTRFVIGTQQSLSVGDNQIFSLMVEQFRELGGRKNHFPFCAKNNILTVVILYNARRNIFSAHIGTCIHVRDEADNRHRLICIGRKGGKQITVFIQRNIFQTQRFQFFFQKPGKYHLPRSTRSYSTLLIRLRIETYIL